MSSGDITITLPTTSSYSVLVKRQGASNTLIVDPGTGRTINGESTQEILFNNTCLQFRFDGTSNWEIV